MSLSEQIRNLSTNIEQLRGQQIEILAQEQQASNRFEQLFAIVARSLRQASDVFVPQNVGSLGSSGTSRESLFRELVQVKIAQQGLTLRTKKLDQQIAQIEARLRTLTQQEQSRQWVAEKTRMATLVALLGLGGGFWVTNEEIASQIAQAQTARVELSLQNQPNETYEALIGRAEAAVLAAVQENFDHNSQVTDVTVMVVAENYGASAPVLSLDVNRSQWSDTPSVQRWSKHFTTARALLGFAGVAKTTSEQAGTATPVIAEQPTNTTLARLETATPITKLDRTPAPSIASEDLPADAAVPVDPPGDNPQKEFWITTKANAQSASNLAFAPQSAKAKTARVDLSLQSQPNETYKTLLSRAEAVALAAVRENFSQKSQVTDVSVMVMAENYGEIAPVLSLRVSRSQWLSRLDIQDGVTYFTSGRSLLGFGGQPGTATPDTEGIDSDLGGSDNTPATTSEQSTSSTLDEETDDPTTTPSPTSDLDTNPDRLPPDAAVPVDPNEGNPQSPTNLPNSVSPDLPSTSTPAGTSQDPLAVPPTSDTINNPTSTSVPDNSGVINNNPTTSTTPNGTIPGTTVPRTSENLNNTIPSTTPNQSIAPPNGTSLEAER